MALTRLVSDYKDSVRAATTVNVTLAGSAPNTLDGVSLALYDRVLVKDQTDTTQNGIYRVTILGTGSNGTWTRSDDFNDYRQISSGAITFVEQGSVNGNVFYFIPGGEPNVQVGSTSITFSNLFSLIDTTNSLQSVTNYGNITTNIISISNTNSATNTTTGALRISGGVGVGGNIYAAAIQDTPIGNGTASTGAFTTLTTSGTITGASQIIGYHTGAIGANIANTGTFTTLSLTSTSNSYGSSQGALQISGGFYAGGDSYIRGNLVVGNITSTGYNQLIANAPLLYLTANAFSTYNYEIGFYSNRVDAQGYEHTGFVRNHLDNAWYLFSNIGTEPGATVDLANASIVYDTLKIGNAIVYGNIVGGYLTGAIGANSANTGIFTNISANGLTINSDAGNYNVLNISGAALVPYGTPQTWKFFTNNTALGSNGSWILFPDNSTQITAYPGTATELTLKNINGYLTGAIGANTANTGNFTTITTTGNLTVGAGGNIYLGSTAVSRFHTGNTAPNSPNLGDTWYQGNTDILFTYIQDANSGRYWFDISSNPSSYGNLTVANTLTLNGNTNNYGTANLGAINQVVITGGTAGYLLKTDGVGGLSWVAPAVASAGGSNTMVQFNDVGTIGGATYLQYNKTSGNLVSNSTSTSTSTTSGALVLSGGAGIGGNLYVGNIVTTSGIFYPNGASAGGSPQGANTMIQFNDNNALGGATFLQYNKTTGNLYSNSTTQSSSKTTGAVVLNGGIGVGGNVFANLITISGSFLYNPNSISQNSAIPSGFNAMTMGPITQNAGVTVWQQPSSRWVII